METIMSEFMYQSFSTKLRRWEHEQELNNLSTALLCYTYPLNYETAKRVSRAVQHTHNSKNVTYFLDDAGNQIMILNLVFEYSPSVKFKVASSTEKNLFELSYTCRVLFHAAFKRATSWDLKQKWYEDVTVYEEAD